MSNRDLNIAMSVALSAEGERRFIEGSKQTAQLYKLYIPAVIEVIAEAKHIEGAATSHGGSETVESIKEYKANLLRALDLLRSTLGDIYKTEGLHMQPEPLANEID